MTGWKIGLLAAVFAAVLAVPARSESSSSGAVNGVDHPPHAGALNNTASRPSTAESNERPSIAGRRIVKHFDFNEQHFDNYESLPMYWRRHGGTGFPQFLEGRFDAAVGHTSSPSFRFNLDGGSVGYHYEGRDISVRTSSDYLVVAWVKTEALQTARAYMTAYYLDRKGNKIAGTEQRSSEIGGGGKSTEWQPITVALPGNTTHSRYIGISLWLTQAGVWDMRPRALRAVEQENIPGLAWFDDITVYRLPRVMLRSRSAGNVFGEREPVELLTEVNDPDGLNLSAKLVIRFAENENLIERPVAIHSGKTAEIESFIFGSLPVGSYQAELVVSTGETVLVRRRLHFLRLSDAVRSPVAGRGFGLVLRDVAPQSLDAQNELLQHVRVEYVKLPVWSPQRALVDVDSNREEMVQYLESIVASGADPIGALVDDADALNHSRSMLDLLSDDPAGWKPLIGGVWSRYAGLIHVWQVGADDDALIYGNPLLPDVLSILRREMKALMSRPLLASSCSLHASSDAEAASDYRSLVLPVQTPPDTIGEQLQVRLEGGTRRSWVSVEALPDERYPRELRLADLSRRLTETYYSDVEAVFLDAPWESQSDESVAQMNPREDLIVFRTVADLLGGTEPAARIVIDGQARGLVFDREGQAVLFVWDSEAPADGREHTLFLGENAVEVDLWGRRKAIQSIGREQVVRIGPTPRFIINTPTWVVRFRDEFALEPARVEADFDVYARTVTFRNTHQQAVNGTVRLFGPEGWDIRPNRATFVLLPGETHRQSIEVRFPLNAESGIIPLVGEFEIDADQRYRILATAWFEFGLKDIDLETYTYRAGDRLIVRQSMTNRTALPVSFDASLVAPGRQRIERSFHNFETGQTVTKDFILDSAGSLAGQKIRVGLKEVQGTRVWNRVIDVP